MQANTYLKMNLTDDQLVTLNKAAYGEDGRASRQQVRAFVGTVVKNAFEQIGIPAEFQNADEIFIDPDNQKKRGRPRKNTSHDDSKTSSVNESEDEDGGTEAAEEYGEE
jgi:hypothetical protein